jgi:murein DD-endopeptidase
MGVEMNPIIVGILCAIFSVYPSAQDEQATYSPYVPVEMKVHVAPTPIDGNGMTNLVYEILLTNDRRKPVELIELEILGDNGRLLKKYGFDDLKRCVKFRGASSDSPGELTLPAGCTAVIFVMLTFDKGAEIPQTLSHALTVNLAASDESKRLFKSEGAVTIVAGEKPVVLGPPLRPGIWQVGDGTGDGLVGHRDSLQVYNGKLVITQRYAIDLMKMGDDMRLLHGDQAVNSSWYSYGQELLAVADGVVASTKDGVIENTPGSGAYAVPMTFETAAGNYVVLDIGKGMYAVYAHLQPGGLLVKVGDKVRKGQVIGYLGNSGASDGPHLHFHVGDSPDLFGGEGLPFVFERFEYLGPFDLSKDDSLTATWPGPSGVSLRIEEIPMGDLVLRFPEQGS